MNDVTFLLCNPLASSVIDRVHCSESTVKKYLIGSFFIRAIACQWNFQLTLEVAQAPKTSPSTREFGEVLSISFFIRPNETKYKPNKQNFPQTRV